MNENTKRYKQYKWYKLFIPFFFVALFRGRRSLKEVGDREKFLLQNIEKGPVPLACLVWVFPEPTATSLDIPNY